MKCKACNGTGYVTACVYKSDEIGFVDKNYECAVCHGIGQIEQTNEEWFCQLPTGEKADFLANIYPKSVGEALIKISNGDKEKWEEWLKEKHDGNT